MRPDIRPDEFTPVTLNKEGVDYDQTLVNAKYDRVDYYQPLGLYMLKFYDDEEGLMTVFTDEINALKVVHGAELPLVEREFIFQSEYEGYLISKESHITDEELGLHFDEDSIIEAVAREKDGED